MDDIIDVMKRLGSFAYLVDVYCKMMKFEDNNFEIIVSDFRVLAPMDTVQGGCPGISCVFRLKAFPVGIETDIGCREYWFLHIDEAERFLDLTMPIVVSRRGCNDLKEFEHRMGELLPKLAKTLTEISETNTGGSLSERLIQRVKQARGI